MGDAIETINLKVYVQENGIVRLADSGVLLCRLDKDGLTYEDLKVMAAKKEQQ
jgi:hypothetical protein